MSDLIDRQAAIDAVKHALAKGLEPSQYIEQLPALQPEKRTDKRTETHACDCIERQAAIDEIKNADVCMAWHGEISAEDAADIAVRVTKRSVVDSVENLPSLQPQITHCAECIHWKHSDVRKSYCEVFDWMSKAEDFCSFAERRTDCNGRD